MNPDPQALAGLIFQYFAVALALAVFVTIAQQRGTK